MAKENVFRIVDSITNAYMDAFNNKHNSNHMSIHIRKKYMDLVCEKMPCGRHYYTREERGLVSGTLHGCRRTHETMNIIHGYWYKGTFYTTNKASHGHHTTRELHDMKLPMEEWDKMQSGLYYADTLDVYFESD